MENSKSFAHQPSYFKARYVFEDRPTAYSFNGPSSNPDELGSSSNPELKRKKRVASYNMYAAEAKLKTSLRNSFKWIKSRFTTDSFDV